MQYFFQAMMIGNLLMLVDNIISQSRDAGEDFQACGRAEFTDQIKSALIAVRENIGDQLSFVDFDERKLTQQCGLERREHVSTRSRRGLEHRKTISFAQTRRGITSYPDQVRDNPSHLLFVASRDQLPRTISSP